MPDVHDRGPARRGRRDPELAEQLAQLPLDPNDLRDEGDDDSQPQFVFDGDIITAKITHEVEIVPKHSSFFSYGMTTRVQPGETEEDVFVRVANTVHERVGLLVEAAEEAYAAEVEARKNTPIQFNG